MQYSLKCFVKHKGWGEFGEGKCVTLPIKIYNSEVKAKVPAIEMPVSFKIKLEEPRILGEKQATSEYYEKHILPKELEWAATNAIQEGEEKDDQPQEESKE